MKRFLLILPLLLSACGEDQREPGKICLEQSNETYKSCGHGGAGCSEYKFCLREKLVCAEPLVLTPYRKRWSNEQVLKCDLPETSKGASR